MVAAREGVEGSKGAWGDAELKALCPDLTSEQTKYAVEALRRRKLGMSDEALGEAVKDDAEFDEVPLACSPKIMIHGCVRYWSSLGCPTHSNAKGCAASSRSKRVASHPHMSMRECTCVCMRAHMISPSNR